MDNPLEALPSPDNSYWIKDWKARYHTPFPYAGYLIVKAHIIPSFLHYTDLP